MNLEQKKLIDRFLGYFSILMLKPAVKFLALFLVRQHDLTPKGDIAVLKMLGGGSLQLAYGALLGVRLKYPEKKMVLITTKAVAPFAKCMNLFDEMIIFDDSSIVKLAVSFAKNFPRLLGVDTLLNFEVHSMLSSTLSTITCARNRLGFYKESLFWRRDLYTHLVYYNTFYGSYYFYEEMCRLIGGFNIAPIDQAGHFMRHNQIDVIRNLNMKSQVHHISLGAFCSELGQERMLTHAQWLQVFKERTKNKGPCVVHLLGAKSNHQEASQLKALLEQELSHLKVENLCGELELKDSIRMISSTQEFWGIDSGLLHYARLMGIPSLSYWGPTDPMTRLKPYDHLKEEIIYKRIPCSPCIHVAETPPCAGNNLCIKIHFEEQHKNVFHHLDDHRATRKKAG